MRVWVEPKLVWAQRVDPSNLLNKQVEHETRVVTRLTRFDLIIAHVKIFVTHISKPSSFTYDETPKTNPIHSIAEQPT